MREETLIRAHADATNRCKGVVGEKQCPYVALPGSDFCIKHGGGLAKSGQTLPEQRQTYDQYQLDETEYIKKLSGRIDDLGSGASRRSLEKEHGILKMMLERLLNTIEDDTQMLLRTGEASKLIDQIQKLRDSDFKIAKETKELLTKDEAKQLLADIQTVIFSAIENYNASITTAIGRLNGEADDDIKQVMLADLNTDQIIEQISDGFLEAVQNVRD
jgi:hypothetical protein